jgi:hypothetical protein
MRLHSDANRSVTTADFFESKTIREEISARAAVFFRER